MTSDIQEHIVGEGKLLHRAVEFMNGVHFLPRFI
jgi:hypothetical protein